MISKNERVEEHSRVDAGSRGVVGSIRQTVAWARGLPEGAQVALYSGTVLTFLIILILAIVYRAAALRVVLILLAVSAGIVVVAALGYGVLAMRRRSLERKEMERRHTADAAAKRQQARAEVLRSIEAGAATPLTDSRGFLLRNSELLWHHCPANVADRKGNTHTGDLFFTSMRLCFVSPSLPVDISIEAINSVNFQETALNVICKTAAATNTFYINDPELAAAHLTRIVAAYHRQVDVGYEQRTRHITQDVKTAVWQRDGGRCVECGAADYLEFDHIIPHSRGGANTVDNIQLLCRRRNGKKGAAI